MKFLSTQETWTYAKINFWTFIDQQLLDHFFDLVKKGFFSEIDKISGYSQDQQGNPLQIRYESGHYDIFPMANHPDPKEGFLEIWGVFSSHHIIMMRNHVLFHLRIFFKEIPSTI